MSRDQETQTAIDEASRLYFEETNDLKLKVFRLQEQIKIMETKHQSEEVLSFEKL